ncbi:OLC1v1005351C1 [Oldenlandia corymbosa var. corymbosa]|uniref:OLC1v1005351C1 n=1 Tax=Oldenlandia corymbosa var. corymbosa TaxID=529605 RepID=A0AAV1DEX9_OLDCO|nr:OLC1v1005351C1 [Oldenlandia corymbosa var. corymbosa]
MATIENKSNKKRKQRYLPQNKPVKKGAYALHPGVQGFFITCDGGRERQASHEAVNVIDSFFEELVHGADSDKGAEEISNQALNKKTKFVYSDSDEDDTEEGDDDKKESKDKVHEGSNDEDNAANDDLVTPAAKEPLPPEKESGLEGNQDSKESMKNNEIQENEQPIKKQCVETGRNNFSELGSSRMEKKSVDELIESELAELGDKNKRRFFHLDSGCNGVVFVQMRKRADDPNPKDIVHYMMASLASSRKHISRFLLRVLPIEFTCYASEEEISRAIEPFIAHYFPVETQNPKKYAVLYEARANTGIDRSKIIDAVAKSVPAPHRVDLGNPDMHIVVQVVKTVCLIGFVEKYKEFAKYNVRQLTSEETT